MSKRFNHLNIPSHWQSYWTRFPEGHTILEALIQWVSQVDEMVDSYNELTDHVDNFKEAVNNTTGGFREELDTFLVQFDDNLAQNVITTLSEWQNSGFLDIVIDKAIETKFHEMDNRLTTQLAQTDDKRFYDSLVNSKKKKKQILWIDDDGWVNFYHYFKRIHRDFGIVANSAIVTNRIGTDDMMSVEQMFELQELGFEFISHTHTHARLPTYSDEELHEQFKTTKEIMRDLGFNTDFLVYPFGDHDARVRDVVRQYFKAGIDTSSGGAGGFNRSPSDQYDLERVNIHQGNAKVFPIIDSAANDNESIIFMSHVTQTGWPSEAEINELISYCLSKGYEFVTASEWLNTQGNLMQVGSTTIDADGNVFDDQFGNLVYDRKLEYSLDTTLSAFPQEKTTIFNITNATAQANGLLSGGTIETIKRTVLTYPFQRLTTITNEVFIRRWNQNESKWDDWEQTGVGHYIPSGNHSFTPDTSIRTFPYGVTYTTVTSNTASETNTPISNGGTLVTHKVVRGAIHHWHWQEYHVIGGGAAGGHGRVYKRSFNSDGTPLDWIQLTN